MIELLALNPSWWQETFLIKVPIGLLAVLLPAGTIVYLYPVSYTHLTLPTNTPV